MKLVLWNPNVHYDLVASWWEAHGDGAIDPKYLPCYGYIVVDEFPRCAGWMSYDPINRIAHFDWFLSNPESPLTFTHAMPLYKAIRDAAEKLGAVALFAQCMDDRMAKCCERAGFEFTGKFTGLMHLI